MEMRRREFLEGVAIGSAAIATPLISAAGTAMSIETPREGLSREEMPRPNLQVGKFVCKGTPFTGKVICEGRPVPHVIVTNGRDSVRTASDGTYRLPEYPEARFISVTVPSGYKTRWFYVDAWRRLGGYDFILERSELTAGEGCRFVHVGDSEIGHAAGAVGFSQDVKALAEKEQCAFIVHTGDICGSNGMIGHLQMMNDFTMGRRVAYCVGNHDLVSTWPWGEAQFEALFGPAWYSFEAGGIHFAVTPMAVGDRTPSYDEDRIADWLRSDLALVGREQPVLIFNHFTPNSPQDARSGFIYGMKRPLDLRKICNYRGIVYGHTHNSWFRRRGETVSINTSNPNMGGIDHSPNCVRIVSVDRSGKVLSKSYFGNFREPVGARAGAKWECRLPAGVLYGGLADGGNALYAATSDDDGRGTGFVVSVDKQSGRIRWQASVENTIKGALAVASGQVVGTDVEGRVTAFDVANGNRTWQVNLSENIECLRPMMSRGTTASPDAKSVAVGCGYRQAVIDVATGRVVWRNAKYWEGEPVPTRSAFVSGRIITPGNWVPARCLDAATGKVLWTYGGFSYPGAMPLVREGKVILALKDSFIELDLETGAEIRRKSYGGMSVAILGDILETDRFYLKGMVDMGLVAIDKHTLEIVWKAPVGAGLVSTNAYGGRGLMSLNTTPVLLNDDVVCASCADGVVYVWDVKEGRKIRSFKTGVPYLGDVVASSGVVYAVDMQGVVRAFEIA